MSTQRFKPKDPVFILPKFAHLYPDNSGVVTSVTVDRFRPMFNAYTVEFKDASKARVFDFQVIEDIPNYQTDIANLFYDSRQQQIPPGTRGQAGERQLVLRTPMFDVDMKVTTDQSRMVIIGQVLERDSPNFLKQIDIGLMKESMLIGITQTDAVGMFKFRDVPRGSLNMLVTIPQHRSRILAPFST